MTVTPILQPGQLEAAIGEIPELRLPPADLFAARGQRFRQLATRHGLAGYLLFLAELAEWQQRELDHYPEIPVPEPHLLKRCHERALSPLSPARWPRQPCWQDAARRAAAAAGQQVPRKGRQALAPLLAADSAWLEMQAEALLHGPAAQCDMAAAPFIGAALQVQWSHLARQLQPGQFGRPELPALCPVCGSAPVASVIRAKGAARGLRFLHCVLCGSEWHVVRAKCSQCDNTKGIEYYAVEGRMQLVQTEVCPECRSYLKIFHQERDPSVDPVADDIATLTLDLLMDEKNYTPISINFF